MNKEQLDLIKRTILELEYEIKDTLDWIQDTQSSLFASHPTNLKLIESCKLRISALEARAQKLKEGI